MKDKTLIVHFFKRIVSFFALVSIAVASSVFLLMSASADKPVEEKPPPKSVFSLLLGQFDEIEKKLDSLLKDIESPKAFERYYQLNTLFTDLQRRFHRVRNNFDEESKSPPPEDPLAKESRKILIKTIRIKTDSIGHAFFDFRRKSFKPFIEWFDYQMSSAEDDENSDFFRLTLFTRMDQVLSHHLLELEHLPDMAKTDGDTLAELEKRLKMEGKAFLDEVINKASAIHSETIRLLAHNVSYDHEKMAPFYNDIINRSRVIFEIEQNHSGDGDEWQILDEISLSYKLSMLSDYYESAIDKISKNEGSLEGWEKQVAMFENNNKDLIKQEKKIDAYMKKDPDDMHCRDLRKYMDEADQIAHQNIDAQLEELKQLGQIIGLSFEKKKQKMLEKGSYKAFYHIMHNQRDIVYRQNSLENIRLEYDKLVKRVSALNQIIKDIMVSKDC